MEPFTELHVSILLRKIELLKKKHWHVVENACSLLLSASIPNEFQREAVFTTVSLINIILSSYSSGLSPFEKLYGRVPDYSSFRVSNFTCFILHPSSSCRM